MMVKERFIEANGPVAHTQGFGCSGGSYQQHQIADNYPGLLDGILPGCSFPEVTLGTVAFITDAWLLDDYFSSVGRLDGGADGARVTGFATYATAPNVAFGARRIDPRVFCGVVPTALALRPGDQPARHPLRRLRPHGERLRARSRGPASRAARSTTSGSSTGSPRSTTARSAPSSSSTSTSTSAASTPTPTSSRPARSPTRWPRAARTRAAGSPTAASGCGPSRSSTTAPTTTTCRTATSTSATTRSRCASACARRTGTPATR